MFHAGRSMQESLHGCLFVAHDADRNRQIASDIIGVGVDPDPFRIRAESVLSDHGHAILADQHDHIGARIGAGAAVAEGMPVGKLASRRQP